MTSPLEGFNARFNLECMSLPHGSFISHEHLEAFSILAAVDSLPHKDGMVSVADLRGLAEELYAQGNRNLKQQYDEQDSPSLEEN